jgi:hypothetical protein
MRVLVSLVLAAAVLAALIPRDLADPERALQNAVAGALATDSDDRLLEAALERYPERAPAIVITYGHLALFRDQLARFGPQVVPIVAAYQTSLTTADALQIAGQALDSVRKRLAGEPPANLAPLTPEDRGLIALLKMRDERNAFVGQWEITAAGEARRVPSRVVTLAGPDLLIGGLTALERDIVEEREIDWRTYGLAAVDLAAIASGVVLLRFARTAARGASVARIAQAPTLRSGALATAKVLGINALRFGVPIGLAALVLHPSVVTYYLWLLAESLGVPGILGAIIGWAIVILPLAFLLSWMLLSVRFLGLTGRIFAAAARGCQRLASRLAASDRRCSVDPAGAGPFPAPTGFGRPERSSSMGHEPVASRWPGDMNAGGVTDDTAKGGAGEIRNASGEQLVRDRP